MWPGLNQMGFSIPSSNSQTELGVGWFLQGGAEDKGKLAVEWEHLALEEPNLQRWLNPWHLLRSFCTKAWWVPPSSSSSSVACFPRTRPQPLCQTEATPSCAPEHTLRVSIKSSNVPVVFFLNKWRNTSNHEQTSVSPPPRSQKWLEMNTRQKRACPLWDKGAAKPCKEWQHRVNVNEEQQNERARTRRRSIMRLQRKAANQNERNCQRSVNTQHGIPSWNRSGAAADPNGWWSERKGFDAALPSNFIWER